MGIGIGFIPLESSSANVAPAPVAKSHSAIGIHRNVINFIADKLSTADRAFCNLTRDMLFRFVRISGGIEFPILTAVTSGYIIKGIISVMLTACAIVIIGSLILFFLTGSEVRGGIGETALGDGVSLEIVAVSAIQLFALRHFNKLL
jgi:hypothetical protein